MSENSNKCLAWRQMSFLYLNIIQQGVYSIHCIHCIHHYIMDGWVGRGKEYIQKAKKCSVWFSASKICRKQGTSWQQIIWEPGKTAFGMLGGGSRHYAAFAWLTSEVSNRWAGNTSLLVLFPDTFKPDYFSYFLHFLLVLRFLFPLPRTPGYEISDINEKIRQMTSTYTWRAQ